MTEKEIWKYCLENNYKKFFAYPRTFLILKEQDFQKINKYFKKDFNVLHISWKTKSLKSYSFWKHIHAVKKDDLYYLHQDHWNYNKFFPLFFLHFFIDFIPHITYCIIKRKKFSFYLESKYYKKAKN